MKTVINYQSPYTETDLHDFLRDPVTTAFCWKLVPHPDSILTDPIAATTHTRDLVLPGHGSLIFRHRGGLRPSAIDLEAGLESAGLSFAAVFSDDAITPEQIDEGHWDGSKLYIYRINYAALKMGQFIEFCGYLGAFNEEGPVFQAEARPLTAFNRLRAGRQASQNCDVRKFGDPVRCQRDLTDLTHTGIAVTTGGSQDTFRASGLAATLVHTMANGLITFTTGDNAPRTRVVRSWNPANGEIVLQRGLPRTIDVGDQFTAIEGCNRTPADCEAYDNIVNFQGQRFMTHIEKVNQIVRVS